MSRRAFARGPGSAGVRQAPVFWRAAGAAQPPPQPRAGPHRAAPLHLHVAAPPTRQNTAPNVAPLWPPKPGRHPAAAAAPKSG
ncbi:MAG: hypothetical protein MUC97_07575 [Bernardetiaceae bacterium]|nr:hypothetical protein [Bernardetiaceae bacterium]